MVYISIGMSRNMKKRECMDAPSLHPPPPRECLPTLLLLQPNYFEQLFSLMHTLSSMTIQIKGGVSTDKSLKVLTTYFEQSFLSCQCLKVSNFVNFDFYLL